MVGGIHGLGSGAWGVALGGRGVVSVLHNQLRPKGILKTVQLLLGVHGSLDGAVGYVSEAPRLPRDVVSLDLAELHPRDQIEQPQQLLLSDGGADKDEQSVADSALVGLVGLAGKEIQRTMSRAGGPQTHPFPRAVALFPHDRCLRGLASKLGRFGLRKYGLQGFIAVLHSDSRGGCLRELDVPKSLALPRLLVSDDVAIVIVSEMLEFLLQVFLCELFRADHEEPRSGTFIVVVCFGC